MKRFGCFWLVIFFLLLVSLGPGAQMAWADTYGDFTYSGTYSGVTITKYNGSGGAVVIPSTINSKPVTAIGQSAFYNCSTMTSCTIPATVTSIAMGAFYYCTGMTSVNIPNGVKVIDDRTFYWCSKLTSVDIPSGVTSIGIEAFIGCAKLTSVTIPSTVKSIGDSAFMGCESIVTTITIPSGVSTIAKNAFNGCYKLPDITIPNTVTSIGENAFYQCRGLTSLPTMSSVTTIGNYAFSGCTSLTEINIPATLTTIGNGVFSGCTQLTTLMIPTNVKTIGSYVFNYCSALKKVYFAGNVPSVDTGIFNNTATDFAIYCLKDYKSKFIAKTALNSYAIKLYNLTVTYNGNSNDGGVVPTDSGRYDQGTDVTVLGNTGSLIRNGYTFNGWNTSITSTTTPAYSTSSTLTIADDTTLYANWFKLAPTLSQVTPTTLKSGTLLTATSDAGGSLYLVPQGSYADLDALKAVTTNVKTISVTASVAASLDTTGLGAGTYYLYAVDSSGNLSDPATITIDNTAPSAATIMTIASQPTTAWRDGYLNADEIAVGQTLRVNLPTTGSFAVAGDTLSVNCDGSQIGSRLLDSADIANGYADVTLTAAILGGLTETTHHLTANLVDIAGNIGSMSEATTLTVDKTAPTATVTYSKSTVKAGDSLTVTADFSETLLDNPVVQIAINGVNTVAATNMTKVSGTRYTYTYTVAGGDGTAIVTLSTGTDAAGNVVVATPVSGASYTVDSTAPNTATIVALVSQPVTAWHDGYLNASEIAAPQTLRVNLPTTGSLAATGDTLYVNCDGNQIGSKLLDSTDIANGYADVALSAVVLSGLTEAAHSLTTNLIDAAGNSGNLSDSLTVTVDKSGPNHSMIMTLISQPVTAWHDGYLNASEIATAQTLRVNLPTVGSLAATGDTLYVNCDGNLIGNKVLDSADIANGYADITLSAAALDGLTEATHSLTTNLIDAAGNSGTISDSLTVTVDKTAPTAVVTYSKSTVKTGDSLTITANFSEALPNAPTIAISGANTVTAVNMTKVSNTQYTYTYTVTGGDGTATVAFGTGTDAAGNVVAATPMSGASYTVDSIAPNTATIVALVFQPVTVWHDGYLNASEIAAGQTLRVNLPTTGSLAVAGDTLYVNCDGSQIGSKSLDSTDITHGYADVVLSAATMGGLTEATHSLTSNLIDAAGNSGTMSDSLTVTVDKTAPMATVTYSKSRVKAGDSVTITATFSEAMLNAPTIAISGANMVTAANMTKVSETQYTYQYTVASGDGTATVAFGAGTDAAGNGVAATPANGASYTVDSTAPTVTSVDVPSAKTYTVGDILSFAVNFSEAVTVTGTPTLGLTVGTATVAATYQSQGSFDNCMVFRYTVAGGDLDTDGITVGTLALNGGTIVDSVGNTAALGLNNIAATQGILITSITVSKDTFQSVTASNGLLTIVLDSKYYRKVEVYVKDKLTLFKAQDIPDGRVLTVPLSQETGSYPIKILVYDYTGGDPVVKALTYNVRVKYVPGRGDGFGWEMWKD